MFLEKHFLAKLIILFVNNFFGYLLNLKVIILKFMNNLLNF